MNLRERKGKENQAMDNQTVNEKEKEFENNDKIKLLEK